MTEQVTYEEANPFSTSADDLADMEPSDIEDKTWRNAMEHYGATEVDEDTVKWEFEKTKENVAKTDPHADYGENVVEITIERLEETGSDDYEEHVLGMGGEFQFTAEILKENVTVTGKTGGPIKALIKVFETAERYDFYHYFKTDVPQEVKDEIFKDEVQSRNWDDVLRTSEQDSETDDDDE